MEQHEANPVKGGQLRPPAVPPRAPTPAMMRIADLPRSFQNMLARIEEEDFRHVQAIVCRIPFVKEGLRALQYADRVWNAARGAEFLVRDRVTGTEMDQYHERFQKAVRGIVVVADELARRSGRSELRQKFRSLLEAYGLTAPDQNGQGGRKPAQETTEPAASVGVA